MAEKDINNLKKELFNLKIMKKSGQLTDTSQFKKLKKANRFTINKRKVEQRCLGAHLLVGSLKDQVTKLSPFLSLDKQLILFIKRSWEFLKST